MTMCCFDQSHYENSCTIVCVDDVINPSRIFSSFHVYEYVVHVRVYIHMCGCTYVFGCPPTCVHVEAWDWCLESSSYSLIFQLVFCSRVSPLNPELTDMLVPLARLLRDLLCNWTFFTLVCKSKLLLTLLVLLILLVSTVVRSLSN